MHGPGRAWSQGGMVPGGVWSWGVVHGPGGDAWSQGGAWSQGVHDPGGCMVPGGAWSRAVRILLECILVWFCVYYFPLLRLRDFYFESHQ